VTGSTKAVPDEYDNPIKLLIEITSPDSATFTLYNASNDTLKTSPVGTNRSRIGFIVGGQRATELYRWRELYSPLLILPWSEVTWTQNISEGLSHIGLESEPNIQMYWNFHGIHSDTIKYR
jgi:hypothetical protein